MILEAILTLACPAKERARDDDCDENKDCTPCAVATYQHRSVNVGDIRTHFLEAGHGPDVILLHGGEYGASAEITWKHNISTLAERFHVIAPDMLGWGETDKIYNFSDPAGYRIKHLEKLLEIIGITKAFFVGNSGGGGTILRASVLEPVPFQIQKMVTICGNASVFKTNFQADPRKLHAITGEHEKTRRITLSRSQVAHRGEYLRAL